MASIPAPLHAAVADGPSDGRAHWLTTSDGVRIRVGIWGADAPRGTVLLFPGRTEYIEKYGRTARDLTERGFATIVIDWRGQGLSDRLLPEPDLGHVRHFSDYQLDIAAMITHARRIGLPEPYFMLAHSMGGCIGLRALMEYLPVRAAAMTSPMWGIRVSPHMRPLAWALSQLSKVVNIGDRLSPGQTLDAYLLTAPFEDNTLTGDREMWDYLRGQLLADRGLCLGGPTLQWIFESFAEMRVLAAAPPPATRCLTWMGTNELIVEPQAIRDRMVRYPNGELRVLDGKRHEILMEDKPTRTAVIDAVAAYFLA
ncbi:MAG: alpha/beta hydrolase [Rhodobacterales bacterium]|jgi:lysophospholipase|nr:alpha/beta hydrolase [Rhodobacterales bacterium]